MATVGASIFNAIELNGLRRSVVQKKPVEGIARKEQRSEFSDVPNLQIEHVCLLFLCLSFALL